MLDYRLRSNKLLDEECLSEFDELDSLIPQTLSESRKRKQLGDSRSSELWLCASADKPDGGDEKYK